MTPFVPSPVTPEHHGLLTAMASVAGAAWSVSRLERGTTDRARADATVVWAIACQQLPDIVDVGEQMLSRARRMHPEETFLILTTLVTIDSERWHVTATSARRNA